MREACSPLTLILRNPAFPSCLFPFIPFPLSYPAGTASSSLGLRFLNLVCFLIGPVGASLASQPWLVGPVSWAPLPTFCLFQSSGALEILSRTLFRAQDFSNLLLPQQEFWVGSLPRFWLFNSILTSYPLLLWSPRAYSAGLDVC